MLIQPLVLARVWTLDSGLQNGNTITRYTRSMMILASFVPLSKERSESKTELEWRRKRFISHNSGSSFYRLSLSVHSSQLLASMQRMSLVPCTLGLMLLLS